MPNMTVSIPHQLSRPEAKNRVEQLITQLRSQFGAQASQVEERWEGDTLHFAVKAMGMAVSGTVAVQDTAVFLDIALPFALAMLSGGVKKRIEEEGRRLLAKS